MSQHMPVVSGIELRRALRRLGWEDDHQTKHLQMRHPEKPGMRVSVPIHRTPLARKTLKSILNQAGITVDQMREVL